MKLFALSSLAGVGLIAATAFTGSTLIEKQAGILKDAKTLKVAYTVRVAGVKSDYTLTYSKPNLLLVDGPDRLIESDGATVWEYDKTAKTYTENPASPELLAKKTKADEVLAWASFFSPDFVKGITNVQQGASRSITGQPSTEVTFSLGTVEPRTVTFYVDDKLGIARGFALKGAHGDILATATKVEISGDAMTPDKFAFSAPAGSSKVVAPSADPNGLGWASVQPVFAANCTPCHSGRGKSGFSVDSYQSVIKGPRRGSIIVAGDPDASQLVKLITGQAQPTMPPGGGISAGDVDKIKAWIKAGAKE